MSQNTHISQFLNSVLADDLSTAKTQLANVMETKLNKRVRDINAILDEGIFDRIGARASGVGAKLGAQATNFGTKISGGVKAAGQAVTGNFKGAAKSLTGAQQSADKNDAAKAEAIAKLQSIKGSVLADLQKLFPGVDPTAVSNVAAAIDAIGQKAKPVVKKRPVIKGLVPSKITAIKQQFAAKKI